LQPIALSNLTLRAPSIRSYEQQEKGEAKWGNRTGKRTREDKPRGGWLTMGRWRGDEEILRHTEQCPACRTVPTDPPSDMARPPPPEEAAKSEDRLA